MTDNPLFGKFSSASGRVTEDQLHAYAAELNGKRFVQAFGWQYFVSKGADGKTYLDRRG